MNNLFKFGYRKTGTKKKDKAFIVRAFQRRFRQKLVDGRIDKECLLISKKLIN